MSKKVTEQTFPFKFLGNCRVYAVIEFEGSIPPSKVSFSGKEMLVVKKLLPSHITAIEMTFALVKRVENVPVKPYKILNTYYQLESIVDENRNTISYNKITFLP